MKKLFLLLILSFFSAQGYAASCPDGSNPVKSLSADGTYFVYNCGGSSNNTSTSTNSSSSASKSSNKNNSKGIDRFGGIHPIPEPANPNDETLKFYLYRYLYSNNIYPFCAADNKELHCEDKKPNYLHSVKPSNNPYQFNSDLREDEYVKNQMQETSLLSYLLYEDGKIVIDEITPEDRFGDMFRDSSRYHSQSVAKTLIGYVAGHAICKGYIDSVDSRLNDWPVLQNTLYHNQKLIDVLNMAAGTQAYFDGSNQFLNSNRAVTSTTVQDAMENELKGSKKSYATYNYNNLNPNIVGSYLIYKIGDDNFQQLLDDVFQKKARIEGDVFFLKNERAKKDDISIWSQFYATRYDYLRIAKAMLDDWQNDTCAGKYLKTIHERRIPKNGVQGTTGRVGMPRSYGGFFHTGFKGMENRPVMAMDGYGGQTFTIDFERGRIVATQAIHDNMKFPKPGSFDWKKIVYERIKNGKPASGTKKPAEPVIDPQQIILEQKAKQEAEKIAKQYWDDYYDAIDDSLVASLIAKAVNPDGKKISKYQNGKTKSEEHYKDGKKEGKFTTWYQSGEIRSETNYKNNSREGTGTSWYVNGQKKAETNYKDGKKEGKFTTWYQSGEIRSETNYKNNSKEGTDTSWYVNGQKNAETIYKNGNKEGKSSAWYDDGQIKLEESYIDDKREGIRTTWYINGQKMYEDNFKNGKFDGKKTHWHDNGQIKSEDNYKDGKRI